MNLYYFAVPQTINLLTGLKSYFAKAKKHAEVKKYDVNTLLQSRLAPDMYPLVKQVQIAGDMAKGGIARLAGMEPPKYDDNETTVEQIEARLDKTIAYLKTFKPEQFDNASELYLSLPFMKDKKMKGNDFIIQMILPNVYFHVTTAYDILRHNGVDLGKADYMGEVTYQN
jgi:hypothetical protein